MTSFEKLLLEAPQSVKVLLEELKGLRENPEFHPEESTFEHIRIVTERLLDTEDMDLILSGFFHDLFKLKTKIINSNTGFPSSPLHDKAVADFIRREDDVQKFIFRNGGNVDNVTFICEQHMRVKIIGEMRSSKRWALMQDKLFSKLCLFTLADKMSNDWSDCFAKWKDPELRGALKVGDVTFDWLTLEETEMQKHKSALPRRRIGITGNELIDMGFPKGIPIGMGIKVADEKMSAGMSLSEILFEFGKVLLSPEDFINDDTLGGLAKVLVHYQVKT